MAWCSQTGRALCAALCGTLSRHWKVTNFGVGCSQTPAYSCRSYFSVSLLWEESWLCCWYWIVIVLEFSIRLETSEANSYLMRKRTRVLFQSWGDFSSSSLHLGRSFSVFTCEVQITSTVTDGKGGINLVHQCYVLSWDAWDEKILEHPRPSENPTAWTSRVVSWL